MSQNLTNEALNNSTAIDQQGRNTHFSQVADVNIHSNRISCVPDPNTKMGRNSVNPQSNQDTGLPNALHNPSLPDGRLTQQGTSQQQDQLQGHPQQPGGNQVHTGGTEQRQSQFTRPSMMPNECRASQQLQKVSHSQHGVYSQRQSQIN
eukprot:Mrub_12791.p1 GENE.Mrub_12791~~Mrub_12791.p1  ORF type:complete len:158 (+),score=40.41 Mrub_12791:29-475(+)